MSMKIFRLSSFLFAIAFAAAAFCFDSRGSAANAIGQNANSSTTMTGNTNAGTTHRRRGRRATKSAPAAADATAAAAEPSAAAAPAETTEQTDLSGTYTGTFDCADAGLTGETTLTITGNQFTTSDGKSGRITAATTRGYTGVAMQFGELVLATGKQPGVSPIIVSMRAKKSRNRLTLTSVPEAKRACSFTPAGAKRAARARRTPPAAPTPAEAAPLPNLPRRQLRRQNLQHLGPRQDRCHLLARQRLAVMAAGAERSRSRPLLLLQELTFRLPPGSFCLDSVLSTQRGRRGCNKPSRPHYMSEINQLHSLSK